MANRPLVWIACAYAAGIAAYAWGWMPQSIGFLAACAACAAVFLFVPSLPSRGKGAALVLMFAALGAIMASAKLSGTQHDALSFRAWAHPRAEITVEGRVRRTDLFMPPANPGLHSRLTFELDVDTVVEGDNRTALSGRAIVHWNDADGSLYPGVRVRVDGLIDPALGRVNFDVDGYEGYLHRRGIHSAIIAEGNGGIEVTGPAPWWWLTNWTGRMRQFQADRLALVLPPRVVPFVYAIWLGERGLISVDGYHRYAAAGTAHILAVSGIHMAILFGTLTFFLPRAQGRRKRAILQIALLLLFALVAGARLSALRAALMFSIYLVADLFNRERDAPTALSIAALVFLAIDPMLLMSTGFLLSFLSVASLLFFSPAPEADAPSWRSGLRTAVRGACTVQLLPLPVALRAFHVLPLLSPVVNLAVIPLLGIAVWLCVITSVTSLFSLSLAAVFGHALWPVVVVIESLTDTTSALPFSHLFLTTPTAMAVAFYIGGLLVAVRGAETRKKKLLFSAPLFAMALFTWRPWVEKPMVAFLDVGHGDATVIRSPGEEVVVIDGGNRYGDHDLGRSVVAPFLWAHGITRIDVLVGTHPDMDHAGGLPTLLDHFAVGEVWLWPRETGLAAEKRILAACAQHGVPVRRMTTPAKIPLTGMAMTLLHPPPDWPDSMENNDLSLVFRLDWAGASALLTGDIEGPSEARLTPELAPATILRVPHHGSHTSSSPPFVQAVQPVAAVVSTGHKEGRVPVHPQVEALYKQLGIPLWRTDLHGGLRLVPAGESFRVESARAAKGYLPPDVLP